MRKKLYFEIFAVSFAAILLEIAFTRVFSFKVYYYFTYLIIGLGLLGLGAGAIVVTLSKRLRDAEPATLIPKVTLAGATSVALAYLVVALTQLNASQLAESPFEQLKLLAVSAVLTAPFVAVGIIVSTILSAHPEAAGRLYGADLVGAALGCTLAVPLLYLLDPPRIIMVAGAALGLAGLRLARAQSRPLAGAGAVVALAMLGTTVSPTLLPDPVTDEAKGLDPETVEFSSWSPVFRIDVVPHPDLWLLHHDGTPGSAFRSLDSSYSKFGHLGKSSRRLPFEVLPPNPKVLIIGSAGGHEVVASLKFGAREVTGVELNPVTLSLLTDHYRETTGNLPDDPRVTLINGDGRWFMAQSEEKYDLIWFVAPDSYAAMNASTSGAFVLAESYLYTVEMLQESIEHLTPTGVICAQFGEYNFDDKANRTTRYLTTLREAYRRQKIPDFKLRVLVGTAAGYQAIKESIILAGRSVFEKPQVSAFESFAVDKIPEGAVRYRPGDLPNGTPVTEAVVREPDLLDDWYRNHRYRIDPVFDDSPFFWNFARFRDALTRDIADAVIIDYEDAIGERMMVILLGLVTVLGATFLFLPFIVIRDVWAEIPRKGQAAIYFAALGTGFMFIEIALIQKLTLFLGYPTYSLSVTLFGLLVFSGIGSILSERYLKRRNLALGRLFAALLALVVAYHGLLPIVTDTFIGSALAVRILLTTLFIAPLGIVLGAFMPLGLATVAAMTKHSREYVAWAWAINAFFSVVASILSTILAMVLGFKLLLLLSALVYLVGILAMVRLPNPEPVD